ncbi:vomeromodulin-like [Cavia porcellus]|uniref:vomeromodulin-like n=1 Tax=Cavia porcellus TaxID=10141 RepID=UPI002FDF75B7
MDATLSSVLQRQQQEEQQLLRTLTINTGQAGKLFHPSIHAGPSACIHGERDLMKTSFQVSAITMWTFWALATMLVTQAGALEQLPLSLVKSLPAPLSVEPPPLPVQLKRFFRSSPTQNSSPPSKQPPEAPGGQCAPASQYFLSAEKLNKYLNVTIPQEIEKLVKCEEVNIIGVLGAMLDMVENAGLMDLIDIPSLLDMGKGGIGGILGSDSKDAESPKLPSLPSVGKAADKLGLGGLLSSDTKELLDSTNPLDGSSLNDVAEGVKSFKDSTVDKMKDLLPAEATDTLKSVLGNLDLKELLLGLIVETVETKDMTSNVTDDGIDIKATSIATIGGEGVAGPIITLVGFQVHLTVSLKIVISTNNSQCISLVTEETKTDVNKVSLRMLETITNTVPLPMDLPLKDIVPKVLSVELQKKVNDSKSCEIVLSDFNECKNSTGLFQFQISSSRTSPEGLSILYCVEALLDKGPVPVPGGHLPPHPKSANVSIIMSSTMVKTVVKHSAKLSSVKSNNMEAIITMAVFNFQQDSSSIQIVYWTTIKRNGENIANGESVLVIKLSGKISSGKMTVNVEASRSEHRVTPPELNDLVKEVLLEVQKKFSSHLNELAKNWNIPSGVSIFPVNNNVTVTSSNDLLVTN